VDQNGEGLAFSLRSRAELCLRNDEESHFVCVVAGPTILQGQNWLDGGYVGLGTIFE
jgi:hypothetical protein